MEFENNFDSNFFMIDNYNGSYFDQGFIGFDDSKDFFNPIKIENNFLAIDEENTTDALSLPERVNQNVSAEENSKENYSKQCLKFCRKISNVIPEYLTTQDQFVQDVLKFNASILEGFANTLQLNKIATSDLVDLQTACLLKLWGSFKDVMSYSKNKKICIVKQEYWGHIFDKKTSTAALKAVFAEIAQSAEMIEGKEYLKDAPFTELLAKMLFASNKVFVLTAILRDTTEKGEYLRKLETIDNFVLLAMLPDFFQYYNHRGGKFAVECCGRCKICRSKNIPADFLYQLQDGRTRVRAVVDQMKQTFDSYGLNSFDLVVSIMEFAYSQF